MSLFVSLLSQLKQKIDTEHAYKDVVISCVKDIVHITLTQDHIISLKEGLLTLRVPPTLRQAVLLKQAALRTALQEQGLPVTIIR